MLNQAWNAITGFGNWVANGLKGIGETLWNFANDPIGSLQKAWDWVSTHQHQAIDAVIEVAAVALIRVRKKYRYLIKPTRISTICLWILSLTCPTVRLIRLLSTLKTLSTLILLSTGK